MKLLVVKLPPLPLSPPPPSVFDSSIVSFAVKDMEMLAKGLVYDKHEISAVPPNEYSERFIRFLESYF